MKTISDELYVTLTYLGIINEEDNDTRNHNVGKSNYSKHIIQPWTVWLDYPELTSFDHDIIKRILRSKEEETEQMKYEKIIHICQERLRQLKFIDKLNNNDIDFENVN